MNNSNTQYHGVKNWQVFAYSAGNLVSNVFLLLMMFVSYLAVGGYGIMTVAAGYIVTGSRIFDGITDPIVGFIVDKTDSKFGRYRPVMVIGWAVMAAAIFCMWFFCVGSGIVMFIALYVIYIIGYTLWNTGYNSARNVVTNEPKQRMMVGRISALYMLLFASVFSFYTSNYLIPKHAGINIPALQEMALTASVVSVICLVICVLSLGTKDKPEYYGSTTAEKVTFRDLFKLLKGNRNLQMMIAAAASDKLASSTSGNSAITTMVWGIIVGNYAFQGQLSLINLIPTILIMFIGTQSAIKKGNKNATIVYSWVSIVFSLVIVAMFVFGDPTQIGTSIVVTVIFIIVNILRAGGMQVTTSIIGPMCADIADYELYRTGKFVSGMVLSAYTFVDKMVSSLSSTLVGVVIAAIGYSTVMPQIGDASTPAILYTAMFLWMGVPVLGWLCSIVAMKWYDLTPERMQEIQQVNNERKTAAQKA